MDVKPPRQSETKSAISKRPNSPASAERVISGKSRVGYIGCVSRDDQDRLTTYATQGDKEAFRQLLTAGLLTGAFTEFKAGEVVYVMDTALLSGLIKIRRRGETVEYWTNLEALE